MTAARSDGMYLHRLVLLVLGVFTCYVLSRGEWVTGDDLPFPTDTELGAYNREIVAASSLVAIPA